MRPAAVVSVGGGPSSGGLAFGDPAFDVRLPFGETLHLGAEGVHRGLEHAPIRVRSSLERAPVRIRSSLERAPVRIQPRGVTQDQDGERDPDDGDRADGRPDDDEELKNSLLQKLEAL